MKVVVVTTIQAPRERVFDLSRSVDAHVASTTGTEEGAIRGKVSGLMALGDEVTWRARHLGVVQELTSRIVAFDRPFHFRDSMVSGAFARFDHDHYFDEGGVGETIARDVFDFDAPLGPLERLAEVIFLGDYMRRFLEARMRVVKELCEGEGYQQFLPP